MSLLILSSVSNLLHHEAGLRDWGSCVLFSFSMTCNLWLYINFLSISYFFCFFILLLRCHRFMLQSLCPSHEKSCKKMWTYSTDWASKWIPSQSAISAWYQKDNWVSCLTNKCKEQIIFVKEQVIFMSVRLGNYTVNWSFTLKNSIYYISTEHLSIIYHWIRTQRNNFK